MYWQADAPCWRCTCFLCCLFVVCFCRTIPVAHKLNTSAFNTVTHLPTSMATSVRCIQKPNDALIVNMTPLLLSEPLVVVGMNVFKAESHNASGTFRSQTFSCAPNILDAFCTCSDLFCFGFHPNLQKQKIYLSSIFTVQPIKIEGSM